MENIDVNEEFLPEQPAKPEWQFYAYVLDGTEFQVASMFRNKAAARRWAGENTPAYVLDTETGKMVYVNPALEKLLHETVRRALQNEDKPAAILRRAAKTLETTIAGLQNEGIIAEEVIVL